MAIYKLNGITPVVHKSSYVHPSASVIGDVEIGKDVFIGPGAVLRGDWGSIIIKDGCNVQDNCILHMFPNKSVVLERNVHIGHGAIIHGAHLHENVLIGMNSVLMDDVVLGKECIVGALSFVKANYTSPERCLIAGNPAKEIKKVTQEMVDWKTQGTQLYQKLPALFEGTLEECDPLREKSEQKKSQAYDYHTWALLKKK